MKKDKKYAKAKKEQEVKIHFFTFQKEIDEVKKIIEGGENFDKYLKEVDLLDGMDENDEIQEKEDNDEIKKFTGLAPPPKKDGSSKKKQKEEPLDLLGVGGDDLLNFGLPNGGQNQKKDSEDAFDFGDFQAPSNQQTQKKADNTDLFDLTK